MREVQFGRSRYSTSDIIKIIENRVVVDADKLLNKDENGLVKKDRAISIRREQALLNGILIPKLKTLVSVSANNVIELRVSITDSVGAYTDAIDRIEIEYSESSSFANSNKVVSYNYSETGHYHSLDLVPNHTYYIRGRAIVRGFYGPFGDPVVFTVPTGAIYVYPIEPGVSVTSNKFLVTVPHVKTSNGIYPIDKLEIRVQNRYNSRDRTTFSTSGSNTYTTWKQFSSNNLYDIYIRARTTDGIFTPYTKVSKKVIKNSGAVSAVYSLSPEFGYTGHVFILNDTIYVTNTYIIYDNVTNKDMTKAIFEISNGRLVDTGYETQHAIEYARTSPNGNYLIFVSRVGNNTVVEKHGVVLSSSPETITIPGTPSIAITDNGYLIWCGGKDTNGNNNLNTAIQTNDPNLTLPNMPVALYEHCFAISSGGNYIIMAGRRSSDDVYNSKVYTLDIATSAWADRGDYSLTEFVNNSRVTSLPNSLLLFIRKNVVYSINLADAVITPMLTISSLKWAYYPSLDSFKDNRVAVYTYGDNDARIIVGDIYK